MKYLVDSVEEKRVSTGKMKKSVGLIEQGSSTVTTDVTIWSDFPGYAAIEVNTVVEGDLVPSKDPKYGPTLYAPRAAGSTPTRTAGGRTASMNTMMEKKSGYVKEAQENKEMGIRVASSFRDATLILTSLYADEVQKLPMEERSEFIKTIHKQIRTWYLAAWEGQKDDLDIPF